MSEAQNSLAKPSNLNLPNLITMLRIMMVPVLLVLICQAYSAGAEMRWLAVVLFIVIAATDGIDGAIARKRGLITNLGKILDPVADKVLTGGAFLVLSALGAVDWWITMAIILRELVVTIHRLVVVRNRVIPAANAGKLKTIMQLIAIGFCISPLDLFFDYRVFDLNYVLVLIALVLTYYSAIDYFVKARKVS
jgi:CDP-diacylglycerol--glycerol-3-phosphate 3-phosphatidyltransferase